MEDQINHTVGQKQKNAWLDEKCMEARNNFNRARNLFLKNKTPTNRQIF